MKNILYIILIMFGFVSCAPKYGAHFSQSSSFYEPAVTTKPDLKSEDVIKEGLKKREKIGSAQLTASSEEKVVKPLPKVRALVEEYEVKAEAIKRKDLSEKEENRALKKETKKVKKKIRKEIKEEVKTLRQQDADGDYIVMMILAIIIPPLGVGLTYGITGEFWLSLILTIIFWLPGAIYSAIIVHNYFRG